MSRKEICEAIGERREWFYAGFRKGLRLAEDELDKKGMRESADLIFEILRKLGNDE